MRRREVEEKYAIWDTPFQALCASHYVLHMRIQRLCCGSNVGGFSMWVPRDWGRLTWPSKQLTVSEPYTCKAMLHKSKKNYIVCSRQPKFKSKVLKQPQILITSDRILTSAMFHRIHCGVKCICCRLLSQFEYGRHQLLL